MRIEELLNSPYTFYLSFAIITLSILHYIWNAKKLPPGPMGVPYLGLWPYLQPDACHLQLTEMAKKYGDVFSFRYTGRLYIHLGSVRTVREAHITKSDCFNERVDAFNLLYYYLKNGVVFIKGDRWKTVRKFFLQQFRERGMNVIQEAFSGPIYDTVRETVEDLKKKEGETVDIGAILLAKCNKIMRQTLFGNDGMSEKEMREFNEYYSETLSSMTSTNFLLVGEFAKYFIFPFTKGFQQGKHGHGCMKKILDKIISRRKSTFDENNVRDCIDAFYKEKLVRQSKNDPTYQYFTDEVLLVSLIQIVGDGVLFLAIFIGAFFKSVLDHPEEQDKIYNELIDVVGVSRNPEIEDKSKLIYTNAFISEVMRTSDVFTLMAGLECSKETTVSGYKIPKGAITLYNFWAAHMNTKDYDEPEIFNPSRFIARDGDKKPDLLPLFGMGKRACMGEGFSMIQVFLFLTTILKNFYITKPVDESSEGNNLFFRYDKFNVCARSRS